MERREIQVFLTLAEELHFGRTAERLRLSQARVSQTIAGLERRVGAPLFARTSRRVELTPIGARLRADLAPAQQRIDEAFARAVAAGREVAGTLRLGFEAPGVADLARHVLDAFRTAHPGSEVLVREVDFTDPFAMLRRGDVDALVTLLPVDEPDLVAGPVLVTEPVVLAVAAGHPFARRAAVTLEDLARDTVLRAARPAPPYWVEPPREWTTAAGAPVRRGPLFVTFQELLAAVAAGEGICPLAAHAAVYFAHPRVVFVPIADGPPVSWALVRPVAAETARVRALTRIAAEADPSGSRRPAAPAP
jgi:DNA-binding transcriptional LysR family regulator